MYLHIYAADSEGTFVKAVFGDGRSYRLEHFTESCRIASELGLPSFDDVMVCQLEQFGEAVQRAEADAVAVDEVRFVRH